MQTVHPSPEAVRLAMARIRRAVDAQWRRLRSPLDWGLVRRDGCRTIACHGGWYALGRLMDHAAVSWRRDADFPPDDAGETLMAVRPDGSATPVMYFEGGHALARDLGVHERACAEGVGGAPSGALGQPPRRAHVRRRRRHRHREAALAALARRGSSALPGIGIEPSADGWRLVRRPYPDSLLPVGDE